MKFRDVPARGHITPQEYNKLVAEVERLGRITAVPPLLLTNNGTGLNLALSDPGFHAKILSSGTLMYAWQEVYWDSKAASWILLTGGRSGTSEKNPAYEDNGSTNVPALTVVFLTAGNNGEYLFSYCCAGSGQSASSSSSTSNSISQSSSSASLCTPVVTDVRCVNGQIEITKVYVTLPPGSSISDSPCYY